jgi:broad specificity phosphatase PhoE
MKIYIVRHGQSTHNANADIPHDPDPPLTALGREQAHLTGIALRDAQTGARALYASPQRRALETANALRQALGLPAQILPELCESGGLREHFGFCREEILSEWPGMVLDERITDRGWWFRGVGDDDEAVFYARAAEAVSLLKERHGGSDDIVIVVSHGRFGSALISTMLGLGPAGYNRYPLDNCAISRVDFDPYNRFAYVPISNSSESEFVGPAIRLRFHNQVWHLPTTHRT